MHLITFRKLIKSVPVLHKVLNGLDPAHLSQLLSLSLLMPPVHQSVSCHMLFSQSGVLFSSTTYC